MHTISPARTGTMTAETDMSRPSKRFVLPYEPEYTAHRTDRHMERVMQLHKLSRLRDVSPSLVPCAAAADSAAGDGSTDPDRALELQPFPHRN